MWHHKNGAHQKERVRKANEQGSKEVHRGSTSRRAISRGDPNPAGVTTCASRPRAAVVTRFRFVSKPARLGSSDIALAFKNETCAVPGGAGGVDSLT